MEDKTAHNYCKAPLKIKVSMLVATCLGVGFLPKAPGTWGTLFAAILIYFFIPLSGPLFFTVLLGLFFVGKTAIDNMEAYNGWRHDDQRIVIDEFLGFMLSVGLLSKEIKIFVAAFVIFRLLDILKPFPIGYLDKKVKNGLGVMLDDVVAGLFTNLIVTFLVKRFL